MNNHMADSHHLSNPAAASKEEARTDSVSIIVCTRNRARSLRSTLKALRRLDREKIEDLELVIVDNNSDDETQEVIRSAREVFPYGIRDTIEDRPGLSRARNTGIEMAKGRLIVFTDDDCLPDPGWLRSMCEAFEGDYDQLIAGQVVLHDEGHLDISVRVGDAPEELTHPAQLFGFAMGANMAFGRSVVDRIGRFDEHLGAGSTLESCEDTDFVYRAFRAGVRVRYEPTVSLRHDHGRKDPREILYMNWGYALGRGAMFAKCLTAGDRSMARPLYWETRSAIRNFARSPRTKWQNIVCYLGYVKGAMRYVMIRRRLGSTK